MCTQVIESERPALQLILDLSKFVYQLIKKNRNWFAISNVFTASISSVRAEKYFKYKCNVITCMSYTCIYAHFITKI